MTTTNSECCTCLPYKDGSLIAAQIISIVAMVLNWWTDPLTGWIGFIAFLCLQIVWCCKMNKCGLITVGVISSIACLANLIVGILVLSGGLLSICNEVETQIKEQYNEYNDSLAADFNDDFFTGNGAVAGAAYVDYNDAGNVAGWLCRGGVTVFGSISIVSGVLWLVVSVLVFTFSCGSRIRQYECTEQKLELENRGYTPRASPAVPAPVHQEGSNNV